MCVLIFSTTFVCNICNSHNSARYNKNVKHPLLLWDINLTLIFSTDFRKLHKRQNLMKIRPEGALFYADGHTHTAKLIVAFRNFVNAPKTIKAQGGFWDISSAAIKESVPLRHEAE
jgi:hypothetical protein